MKTYRNLIVVFMLIIFTGILLAQAPKWKTLGSRKVTFRTERDVINVGVLDGVFKRIKLTVHNSGVRMKDMKVHFRNGDVIDVKIRKVIPAGGETRIIDLPGKNRIIKKVVFWYESTKKNARRATVKLHGVR